MTPADIESILKLPELERREIAERIWESLEEDAIPVTNEEVTFAKERLKEFEKNRESSLDWKEVKNNLYHKYGLDNQD